MKIFEQRLALFWILFALPLLFFPKINLLGFEDETAGIRIDDLFLFSFSMLLFWGHFSLRKQLTPVEFWMAAITVFSCFSFAINRLLVEADILHVPAKIFYCFRLLEYFMFFYLGAFAASVFNMRRIILAFFLWNAVLIILQKFALIGGITVGGYVADISARPHGIASFPSEMGLLLNMLFCYLVFTEPPEHAWRWLPPAVAGIIKQTWVYALFILFALLVIFTANRISIVTLLIPFFFRIKQDISPRRFLIVTASVGLIVFGMILTAKNTAAVLARSADLFSMRNFALIPRVWESINININPVGNESVSLENYDASWWMRIHKWIYTLKIYCLHPECYLQGIGPGFSVYAVDGSYIRILSELGVIGGWMFWKFFQTIWRASPALKWMVVVLLINMITFEAYLAYKPMSLLFLALGEKHAKERIKAKG